MPPYSIEYLKRLFGPEYFKKFSVKITLLFIASKLSAFKNSFFKHLI